MKILVMGSGGVGGYFGGRLAGAGNDVTFVARGAHLAAIQKDGLHLDSQLGNLTIKPAKATADPAEAGVPDLILFATKMGENFSRILFIKDGGLEAVAGTALEVEEILFAAEAAAVAAELAIFVDDAVAGDEDGDAVEAVGAAGGADGSRMLDGGG